MGARYPQLRLISPMLLRSKEVQVKMLWNWWGWASLWGFSTSQILSSCLFFFPRLAFNLLGLRNLSDIVSAIWFLTPPPHPMFLLVCQNRYQPGKNVICKLRRLLFWSPQPRLHESRAVYFSLWKHVLGQLSLSPPEKGGGAGVLVQSSISAAARRGKMRANC